jgi:di/tricarboxylate transporter
MATALRKTGGIDIITSGLTSAFGGHGPVAMLAGIFLVTSVLSQFISNTATAVLMAPIAFQAATGMDVSVRPFMMALAIAASTSFSTPIASPVNTMVLAPGGYRFTDYLKAGIGLQLLMMLGTIIFVPLIFPF